MADDSDFGSPLAVEPLYERSFRLSMQIHSISTIQKVI